MSVSVQVADLQFSYGERKVLQGVCHRFHPGSITGLLGPNGCGKSTLIKNLLGFLKPSGGTISFFNEDKELSIGRDRSRVVSLVPQRLSEMGSETVFDSVLMGRLPYIQSRWVGFSSKDRQRTELILQRLQLESFSQRLVGNLSGGEQQKVMLARCLVQETPIILLDEATANLDLQHKVSIMETIQSHVERTGATVIAVMHDLNLAAQYCSSLVFLKDGQSWCSGCPIETMTPKTLEEIYSISTTVHQDEQGLPFVLPGRQCRFTSMHTELQDVVAYVH